jgi:hypothetical protein
LQVPEWQELAKDRRKWRKRQHGRYYIHKNTIKKAGTSPKHTLTAVWCGCEGMSQYISIVLLSILPGRPRSEEQIRSW